MQASFLLKVKWGASFSPNNSELNRAFELFRAFVHELEKSFKFERFYRQNLGEMAIKPSYYVNVFSKTDKYSDLF